MWSVEVGGRVHSKNRLVSSIAQSYGAAKIAFLSVLPVNILRGVARRLLGPHDTLPCVLIEQSLTLIQQSGNAHNTLIKQSALEHNLDFESKILSIIGN